MILKLLAIGSVFVDAFSNAGCLYTIYTPCDAVGAAFLLLCYKLLVLGEQQNAQ